MRTQETQRLYQQQQQTKKKVDCDSQVDHQTSEKESSTSFPTI